MDLLLVIYKSQKNAWIDSVKFEEWVRKVDRKMRAANRQILLFIDNCTAHMSVAGLTNTRLIFFPPNCTSKLQPADQGIIQNLKVHYRQTMIRRTLQYVDEDKPIKAIHLKDAIFMAAKTWDNREFKQITSAGATTAAVTKKVWGEYVSAVCQILSVG